MDIQEAAFRVLLSWHPKVRTVRKIADQPTTCRRPGVRGVRDRPTNSRPAGAARGRAAEASQQSKRPSSARGAMPTRISLRRVGASTGKLMAVYPIRWLMAVPDSLAAQVFGQ